MKKSWTEPRERTGFEMAEFLTTKDLPFVRFTNPDVFVSCVKIQTNLEKEDKEMLLKNGWKEWELARSKILQPPLSENEFCFESTIPIGDMDGLVFGKAILKDGNVFFDDVKRCTFYYDPDTDAHSQITCNKY